MIVLKQNRIKNYSDGRLYVDPLCIFFFSKLPQVMGTITKYIIVVYSMFTNCVILAQTTTYDLKDSIQKYEIGLTIPNYITSEAEQFDSYMTGGINLQESGQHDKALMAFQKAWEIDRIQNGLYSESQISIIEKIISSYTELSKWDSVNEQFEYLEHLYWRIYEIDNPRFELGLRKISSWHINALNENLDDKRLMHLRKVHEISKIRLNILRPVVGPGDPIFEYLSVNIALSKSELYLYSRIGGEIAYAQTLPSGESLIVYLN